MCFRELLDRVRQHRPGITPAQIRWAITSGKVSRPPLDGSLRFVFGETHLQEMVACFGGTNHHSGDGITG